MNLIRRQPQFIENARLSWLLGQLGVARKQTKQGYRAYQLHRADDHQLRDFYLEARRRWKALLSRCHPDRHGSHDEAAKWNLIWEQVKRRFGQKGIEL